MKKKLVDVSEKDWRALLGLNKSSKFKRNKKSRAHSQPTIVDDELGLPFDDSARLDFSNMEDNRRSSKRHAIPFSDMVGNKRGKFGDQLSENSQASETVYRILCHSRKIGSVIGKGGGIVKALREETQAKITVADSVPGSEERVIVVYSFSTKNPVTQNTDMELQCAAQDALLKVHDRIVEEESGTGNETVVTARLLVPNNMVGCLLGKNGDVIKRLRSETGASIRVLPADQLPICAMSTDGLVQISAKPAIARRALYEVSTLLHQNPRKGFPIHPLMSNLPPTANQMWPKRGSSARGGWREEYEHSRFGPADFDGDRVVSRGGEAPAEFSMKILCPDAKIGGVIGKGGSNVRQVQQETGTNIHVDDVSGDSDERVIRVCAFERLVGKSKGVARSRLGLKFRLMKKKRSNKTRFRAKKKLVKSRIYLDGSFLFHCFIHKMDIRNINDMFKGMKVEIATTDCTWEELSCYVDQFTEHRFTSIYYSMKDQVSTINCGHKDSMHAQYCIMSLVGGNNKNTTLIASHDRCFLQKLSENPLIPVVVIEGSDFVLKCLSKKQRRELRISNPVIETASEDDPNEKRLMDRVNFYNFAHIKVTGDGNCMLRALSEQLTHSEHKHPKVRRVLFHQFRLNEELYAEEVKMYMESNPKIYGRHPTYSDFLIKFSKDTAMVPDVTVQAASDFFKAKIVCICSDKESVFMEYNPHDMGDPERVLYLSLLSGEEGEEGHADSVYPQQSTPSESCRHLIDLDALSDDTVIEKRGDKRGDNDSDSGDGGDTVIEKRGGRKTRNKRTKRSRKTNLSDTLTFYREQLGFKKPSTVILDASIFYYLAVKGLTTKHIKDVIKDPTAVLRTTRCVLRELDFFSLTYCSSGDPLDQPIQLANLVELEGCLHGKEITAEKCIRTIVGIHNSDKMFVATRVNHFWPLVDENPLIPIITVKNGGLVLKELSRHMRWRAKNWCLTFPIEKPAFTDTELKETPDYERLLKRFAFYGFNGEITVNDTESQFKAISKQLGPSEWPYKAVKGFVVDQMLLHSERYTECHIDYMVQVSRDGQWGDEDTLQAAADFFGVEIVVVNSSKKDAPVSSYTPYGVEHPKKAIYLSCLTIGHEDHYNSVQRQPTGSFPTTCSYNYMEGPEELSCRWD